MKERTHLSFSQLRTYLDCPLRYWYQYVLGLKPATVPASLAFGGSLHRAIAFHLQSALALDPLPAGEVVAYFEADWSETCEREPISFSKGTADTLEAQGKEILAVYLGTPAPAGYRLTGIEETFSLTLTDDLPPLKGAIDAFYVREEDEHAALVIDFKTSAAAYPESRVTHDLQLSCYALALADQGFPLESLQVGFTVLTKTKTPRVQTLVAGRNQAQLAQTVQLARTLHAAIASEVFYPRRDVYCAGCPFNELCEAW